MSCRRLCKLPGGAFIMHFGALFLMFAVVLFEGLRGRAGVRDTLIHLNDLDYRAFFAACKVGACGQV